MCDSDSEIICSATYVYSYSATIIVRVKYLFSVLSSHLYTPNRNVCKHDIATKTDITCS